MIIACDNKASLEIPYTMQLQGVAMIFCRAIHKLRKDLPIILIPKHVKGHQDSK